MSDSFIHLQAHSEYSLSKGLLRMTELVGFAKAQGMHSIALTDEMNLFAAVKFYQECEKQGVKPIIGCDLYCHHSDQTAKLHSANHPSFRLTLLVKNQHSHISSISCNFLSRFYHLQSTQYNRMFTYNFSHFWRAALALSLIDLRGW